jgi:hypothetical protein
VMRSMIIGFEILFGIHQFQDQSEIALTVLTLTTTMTSIWAVLIMLSSGVLKLVGSINLLMRVVRWMFDVDAHPVRVLGLVAAAIVWIGSIIYGYI